MAKLSPAGALIRGLIAGAAGSLAQNLFFRATRALAPPSRSNAFTPPEPVQQDEGSTETVARRTVEGLMQRGPLEDKGRAGAMVHYAFGAAWGGAYGLLRGSAPRLARPLGVVAFGTGVWMASDNLILPAFRLAGWPTAYPARNHAYAWVAHIVFGVAVWASFEAMCSGTWVPLGTALGARRAARGLHPRLRAPALGVVTAARAARPVARVRAAIEAAREA